jgi:hypothetical protein
VRTTLDIETPILRELKAIQKREGVTLGALVSRLLADALARRGTAAAEPTFEWASRPMRARVDIEDKDALQAALDDPGEQ